MEGAGPQHWGLALRGWFPLAPWPESHHWLSFLVVGILFTVSGLGLTRRRPFAWISLTVLLFYQLAWVLLAALGTVGPGSVSGVASLLAGGGIILLALLARAGLALWRTPPRDAYQMQLRAQEKQKAGD